MKLLCTGGGTGGHIYPAFAILESLRKLCRTHDHSLELLWVGRRRGLSQRLVRDAGIPYVNVPSGQIRGVNPLIRILSLVRLAVGTLQALWIVFRFRPDACLATGGNAAAPAALACHLLRVPMLVFLPDAAPGMTARLLGRLATRILVTTEAAERHFPGRTTVTGYPVRADLPPAMCDRRAARRRLGQALDQGTGFAADLPLVLVMGGSLGARSLNQAILDCAAELLPHCVLLLVTGEAEHQRAQREARTLALAPELRGRLVVYPYLHAEAPLALAAADLAVSRAGASVLGEMPVSQTPAILVPLPYSGGHQWHNAQALADQDACLVVDEADLARQLAPALMELLTHPAQCRILRRKLARLARPDAADRAAQVVFDILAAQG